ncbi:MAG: RHS repeat-associated core domain-containing protein [Taibaiella sp.]|nr:RHS repeat-associated core domain-containing protein [Taibaiella sp.]
MKLNSGVYISDLHYDAKGQRMAIWYGNGTKTGYTYDPLTFRLRRLLTTGTSGTVIYQDLHYWYDASGNITEIQDDAQQTLYFNNSVVAPTQEFTYDALYRLIEAKGRELIGTASFGTEDNWNDSAWQTTHKGNGNAVQNYTQQYSYDEAGNILQVQHIASTGSYTRTYDIDTSSNRLLHTQAGANTYNYRYNAGGNMIEMPHLPEMNWNAVHELYQITRGTDSTNYQYSGGQRIRKYTDKGSIREERIYLGSFEIYRRFESSSLIVERQTVHVSDDTGRIAMLEKRTVGNAGDDNNTAATLVRYIYSNHLQSAALELDDTVAIISYEEYHPYGTTSYQAMNTAIHAVAKRYRYTGKERDEESGLYYHGARYYIPWLARWTAVDPLEAEYAGLSPYHYSFNNPVMFNDPSGMGPEDESNGILSKEGQQKLLDWAVNTHTVKMAKERGNRIIIDQFF